MPSGQPRAAVPQDLQGMRGQNIALLQQLLFGGPPQTQRANSFHGQALQALNGAPGPTMGGGDPLARLEAFFGKLGSPQSSLQRQGSDAIGEMLRGPTPEQQALNIALPQLQEMLTGQGPQFERDLALANNQGGRFGSANALLRGEALRNLFNLRNQTAGTLGMLSGSAGQANRGLAGQAFATGQAQAGQADLETQRRLQILLHLLGVSQEASFNHPTQEGGGGLGGFLGGLGGMALGSFLPGFGNAIGAAVGRKIGGG